MILKQSSIRLQCILSNDSELIQYSSVILTFSETAHHVSVMLTTLFTKWFRNSTPCFSHTHNVIYQVVLKQYTWSQSCSQCYLPSDSETVHLVSVMLTLLFTRCFWNSTPCFSHAHNVIYQVILKQSTMFQSCLQSITCVMILQLYTTFQAWSHLFMQWFQTVYHLSVMPSDSQTQQHNSAKLIFCDLLCGSRSFKSIKGQVQG